MLNLNMLDEDINMYYDEQMSSSDLLHLEARMARSKYVRDYANEKCFDYYKISSSISRVNKRLEKLALLEYWVYFDDKIKFGRVSKITKIKNFLNKIFKFS